MGFHGGRPIGVENLALSWRFRFAGRCEVRFTPYGCDIAHAARHPAVKTGHGRPDDPSFREGAPAAPPSFVCKLRAYVEEPA